MENLDAFMAKKKDKESKQARSESPQLRVKQEQRVKKEQKERK